MNDTDIKDMAVYSPLALLYSAYTCERPIADTVISEKFQDLDKLLAPLPLEVQNAVFETFCKIYTENERLAFTAGVRVGIQLAKELFPDLL